MAITSGINIVRVAGHRIGRQGLSDVIMFIFVNRSEDKLEIAYSTPAGGTPAKLVRDLIEIMKTGIWVAVHFVEQQGMLVIRSIREPEISQEELSAFGPKVRLN